MNPDCVREALQAAVYQADALGHFDGLGDTPAMRVIARPGDTIPALSRITLVRPARRGRWVYAENPNGFARPIGASQFLFSTTFYGLHDRGLDASGLSLELDTGAAGPRLTVRLVGQAWRIRWPASFHSKYMT